MKPFSKIKSRSCLSYYSDEESRIVALITNYSSESDRLAVLKEFIAEGGITFAEELFKDAPQRTYFELWVSGELVGLLSVDMEVYLRRKVEPYIYLSPLGVFILKKYRTQGLGRFMAETSGHFYAKKILKSISNCSIDTMSVEVKFYADYESEEGEMFFDQFKSPITDYALPVIAENIGLNLVFDIDVGYSS